MRVINLVDSVDPLNFGIWNTVLDNAGGLQKVSVQSEIWFPKSDFDAHPAYAVPLESFSTRYLLSIVGSRKLDPSSDIIVSHGSWRYPSRWGSWLQDKGFKWIYMPHGMLDPWAMEQKKIKKLIYYYLIERALIRKADAIRVVSVPEKNRLAANFDPFKVFFIPNGIKIGEKSEACTGKTVPRKFLFLSRLHHKKNIVTLLKAWANSRLNNRSEYEFIIAGPDHGELQNLLPIIDASSNMRYIGSIYGDEKIELIRECSFFVLSSFSEGLPTSLLEAMNYGLVPIITEGCNLPQVFSDGLGLRISTEINDITRVFNETISWDEKRIANLGHQCRNFVEDNFSMEKTIELQMQLFEHLLRGEILRMEK